jgi:uncharacterized protein
MVSGYLYLLGFAMQESYFPRIFGMFLIGLYVGRKRIYANLEAHTGLFKKIFLWGSLIGLPACGAMAYTALTMKQYGPGEDLFSVHFYHTVFYSIGVAPLSLAYASALCLIWIKTKGNTTFRWLAPVGRMALTNYLVQSLIGIFIYYGIGLGLGNQYGPSVFFPISLVVFMLQVLYSYWWLKHFKYGPFEWIWRMLTYGRILALGQEKPNIRAEIQYDK